jgi:hypothetical protein
MRSCSPISVLVGVSWHGLKAGGAWTWIERSYLVYSIVTGGGVTTLMAWFSSIEDAPWPVVIFGSSAVFLFVSAGTLGFILALRHLLNPFRTAHAHLYLDGALWHFKNSAGVDSVTDEGLGHVTLTWNRPFSDSHYHVSVSPNGCAAEIHSQTPGSLALVFRNLRGVPRDPPTINVMATGKRARWWHLG